MYRVFLIYALSGFVSLGYQVAWFRIYVDRFGSQVRYDGGLHVGCGQNPACLGLFYHHCKIEFVEDVLNQYHGFCPFLDKAVSAS